MCEGKLLRNAAKCNRCGDVIESKHRHDFVACSCDGIFVDGGLDYLRFGWQPMIDDDGSQVAPMTDMCEYDGNCTCDPSEEVKDNDCYA